MMRASLAVGVAAAAFMIGIGPAAAAPQILGIVASNGVLPLSCDASGCHADLSTFCLQQPRANPDLGQRYQLAEANSVTLVGTKSNRDAIGARVRIEAGGRAQTTFVRGDGSYLSHSDRRAHFGLGEAARVDRVEIRWPSGLVETATALAVNRFYVAAEGKGIAEGK